MRVFVNKEPVGNLFGWLEVCVLGVIMMASKISELNVERAKPLTKTRVTTLPGKTWNLTIYAKKKAGI